MKRSSPWPYRSRSPAEGPFATRLRLPTGYEIAPHFHSQIEHVTVLAGTLHFGMGEKFDRANTRPMPVGSFGYCRSACATTDGSRARRSCSSTARGRGRHLRESRRRPAPVAMSNWDSLVRLVS